LAFNKKEIKLLRNDDEIIQIKITIVKYRILHISRKKENNIT
jgi:hypothetical protein